MEKTNKFFYSEENGALFKGDIDILKKSQHEGQIFEVTKVFNNTWVIQKMKLIPEDQIIREALVVKLGEMADADLATPEGAFVAQKSHEENGK